MTPRDIYNNYNVIFKDTNTRDLKESRPCVFITSVNNKNYYLTFRTENDNALKYHNAHKKETYMLRKNKVPNLAKTSLISLNNIYDNDFAGRFLTIVPHNEYLKILKKLVIWQEQHPDPLYAEIRQCITEIIKNN